MDYCETCVYYPPSSCDGKPCTQCDPERLFHNCYVNKEDYITKERMDKRLAMMHKLYPDAKPSNADRIRNMGDIELANFLSGLTNGCVNCPMYYPEEDDECIKRCNSAWQEWVRKESEDK